MYVSEDLEVENYLEYDTNVVNEEEESEKIISQIFQEIYKNNANYNMILCDASEDLRKKADEKLEASITEVSIGITEIGMGLFGIYEGNISSGANDCVKGAYEIKESYEDFKEAKDLYNQSREK